VLTTNQKGAIAEAAIIHEATKLGIPVLRPTTDERYDIVLDLRGRFVRVQCKWAALKGEVVAFPCRSCRRAREGLRHRPYRSEEIDAFAAYCADLDRSFYVPMHVAQGRLAIQFRISPTRNNQRVGVNWADDFDFAATIDRAGP
jgi:hypothetical protein